MSNQEQDRSISQQVHTPPGVHQWRHSSTEWQVQWRREILSVLLLSIAGRHLTTNRCYSAIKVDWVVYSINRPPLVRNLILWAVWFRVSSFEHPYITTTNTNGGTCFTFQFDVYSAVVGVMELLQQLVAELLYTDDSVISDTNQTYSGWWWCPLCRWRLTINAGALNAWSLITADRLSSSDFQPLRNLGGHQ